jgi:hypothetical protein
MNKIKEAIKTEKEYIIIESDGTERHICNLYYGQMIDIYNGYFYYKKEVPEAYFEKAKLLKRNGWNTGYHYEDWYKDNWTEYGGVNTETALRELKETKQ